MIGCPDANELAQLVDGRLADAARRRVECHLDACGACTHALAELAWIVAPPPPQTERAWRAKQPRSRAEILEVWRRALAGLHALHGVGLTHTLTPDHVFVDGERVVLGDFGCTVERTSGYFAPELLAGAPPSPRADQFAACVAIIEALTGRRPFTGATAGALAVAIAAPREPLGLGRALDAALARGLAADPAARWPDVTALADALGRRSWFARWMRRG